MSDVTCKVITTHTFGQCIQHFDRDFMADTSKLINDLRERVKKAEEDARAAGWRAHDFPQVAAERDALRLSLEAAERELERWRHGVTVEGDYVCPDSLRMTELERLLEEEDPRLAREMEEVGKLRTLADTLAKALRLHASQGLGRDGLCWCLYVQVVHPEDDPHDAVPLRDGHTEDCWTCRTALKSYDEQTTTRLTGFDKWVNEKTAQDPTFAEALARAEADLLADAGEATPCPNPDCFGGFTWHSENGPNPKNITSKKCFVCNGRGVLPR